MPPSSCCCSRQCNRTSRWPTGWAIRAGQRPAGYGKRRSGEDKRPGTRPTDGGASRIHGGCRAGMQQMTQSMKNAGLRDALGNTGTRFKDRLRRPEDD